MSLDIKKIGIIAGGGDIPLQLIEYCQANSIDCFVVALQSHAQKKITKAVPHIWARIGDIGTIFSTLKKEQIKEIILIGSVKRPSFSEIRPDWEGVKILASIAKKALGDDSLLRLVIEEIERKGFRVIGVNDVMPNLLSEVGVYGKIKPNKADMRDIEFGCNVALSLGHADVGQGVVVQDGIVLAVEAIEGTDAMIERAGKLKRDGKSPVLVKTKKPHQDVRIDLPTIGKKTIENAFEAGFKGVAIQAGNVLIVNKKEVIDFANSKGMFIMGVDVVNKKEGTNNAD